jgi:hypothetical protein
MRFFVKEKRDEAAMQAIRKKGELKGERKRKIKTFIMTISSGLFYLGTMRSYILPISLWRS